MNSHCVTKFLDKFGSKDQYGFIKDPRQEKPTDFTAINAISSSDNETSDVELDKINSELADLLHGLELRKRSYFVNMPSTVYSIGGYIFDAIRKERHAPKNDWKWDVERKKLSKIPPIPGEGRVNFGIAANDGKVVVIGGNTLSNRPTETCYIFEDSNDTWEKLPSLPKPLCGPAVSLDDKETLFVFGGYDLVSGNVVFRNDFVKLDSLSSKKWITLPNTVTIDDKTQPIRPRARALLVACTDDVIPPKGGLFACGGYTKTADSELSPVAEILCYDHDKKQWIFLSEIPNLKKLNIFAVDNNILVISDKVKSNDPDEEDELVPLSKYDLANRKWLMIDKKEVENQQ